MAEDKAAAAVAADEDEIAFEAPDRGSADELLDAGAHAPIDAMRHSTAHVMAEAVLALFPGARLGIGPAIANGFYYDFDLPRPLTPDDLAAVEARMRESVGRGPCLRPPRGGRSTPVGRSRRPTARRSRSRSSTILRRRRCETATPMPAVTFYEHGPFRDLCKGPHVGVHRPHRPVQAPRRRRGVLAGRREAPDAPADLRHGLGDAGGAGPVPLAPRGGEEAGPPQAGRRAGPVQFHDVSPGSAFWHPKGQRIWRTLETAMRELQERRGYEEISTPILVTERLWRAVRPLGPLRATTCSSSRPRVRRSASSR